MRNEKGERELHGRKGEIRERRGSERLEKIQNEWEQEENYKEVGKTKPTEEGKGKEDGTVGKEGEEDRKEEKRWKMKG